MSAYRLTYPNPTPTNNNNFSINSNGAKGKVGGGQGKTARLFVGQLNFEATEYDIQQIFSFYGHVLHVNILRSQHDPASSTGSAFVTYSSTVEADCAIQSLHDKYNMGRDKALQVSYCRRTEDISEFGIEHAKLLNENNSCNPVPSFDHNTQKYSSDGNTNAAAGAPPVNRVAVPVGGAA